MSIPTRQTVKINSAYYFEKVWDVLVVGAGPAGLFTALSVASNSNLDVLVIEAGPDIDKRRREFMQGYESLDERSSYVTGVGGAGLYSDGKICFSLEVGGQLENNLSGEKKNRLLRTIAEYLGLLPEYQRLEVAGKDQIEAAKAIAARAGLDFKYYPVLSIGTERSRDLIIELRDRILATETRILSRCELKSVCINRDEVKEAAVSLDGEERILKARTLVLALGKVGAARESMICQDLGVLVSQGPMYVGVRLETETENLQPLFSIAKDPKYSMYFPDGSKVKTHCASRDGQVLALAYEGLPMAGGHNFHQYATGRSGFSVLWDGIRIRNNPYEQAKEIMCAIGRYTDGRLLAQALGDYRAGIPSTEISLRDIKLSNPIYKPGDIRKYLPAEYFANLNLFLERLSTLVPGIFGEQTVLYAPAIEWWMNRIDVDHNMETACEGLYVCGDGSGWSQGIVHSAATGLLAAEGIRAKFLIPSKTSRTTVTLM
jgi:uncharacterized protein